MLVRFVSFIPSTNLTRSALAGVHANTRIGTTVAKITATTVYVTDGSSLLKQYTRQIRGMVLGTLGTVECTALEYNTAQWASNPFGSCLRYTLSNSTMHCHEYEISPVSPVAAVIAAAQEDLHFLSRVVDRAPTGSLETSCGCSGEKNVGDLTDQGTKKRYGYIPSHPSFLSSHYSIRIAVASSVVSCYITGPCSQPVRVLRYHTLEVCIMYYYIVQYGVQATRKLHAYRSD